MRSMTAAAVPLALSGYEVIVDFSIPPWFLETALKIVSRRNIPLDYVVLLPTLAICAERAATRPEGKIDDYTPYADLYDSFVEAGDPFTITTPSDAKAVAAELRTALNAACFRVNISVPKLTEGP